MTTEQLVLQYKQNPSPQLFEKIYKSVSNTIKHHVRKYSASGLPEDVLELQARKMLAKAIDAYDPSKSSFSTFLSAYLQKLYRFVNTYQHPVKLPENYKLNYPKYETAKHELELRFGYEPSAEQIARHANIPLQQVRAFERRAIESATPDAWATFTTSDLRAKEVMEDLKKEFGERAVQELELYLERGIKPKSSIFNKVLKEFKKRMEG